MRLLASLLLTASCVTPGDLAELQVSTASLRNEIAMERQRMASGAISQGEYSRRVDSAVESHDRGVEDVQERAAQRIPAPITGYPMADLLLAAVGTIATSVFATNRVRDRRRLRRGESV